MKYDFDEIIPRRGTNSVKWDEAPFEGEFTGTPLWVADMDFRTYPRIIEALHRRVEHGIFGYTLVPGSYYESVVRWFARQHGWTGIRREDIVYTSGVVPVLSAIIRALTLPGDKVLVQSPVYNCFFSSIRNQGCQIEDAPLVRVPSAKGKSVFTYEIDWDCFESACADPKTRLFLLCNPHNPAGRVWTPGELRRMGDICQRHGVFVVADEIHCEIVMPGYRYTPFASLGEDYARNSATCVSPTKGFNIAGLQIANIIVTDGGKRERIDRAINIHEVCDVNPFGVIALQEAYTDGGAEWLGQMNAYVEGNYQLLLRSFPDFPIALLEGTYLAWMDVSSTGMPASAFVEDTLRRRHVWLNEGAMYGDLSEKYVRVNLACPRLLLQQSFDAIRAV